MQVFHTMGLRYTLEHAFMRSAEGLTRSSDPAPACFLFDTVLLMAAHCLTRCTIAPRRFESAELFWMLHDCGVPAKHLVYNKITHGDFVTGWTPQTSGKVRR